MIRSLFLAIIVISCSPYPALGANPRAEAELDKWLENLSHPAPFISKRAAAWVKMKTSVFTVDCAQNGVPPTRGTCKSL